MTTTEELQRIHEATMEVLSTVGMRFLSPRAQELLKSNGIRVEGEVAYFTEEQLMHWVKMAPNSFTVYARNPKYDVVIGGDEVNSAPPYGSPYIADAAGARRPGTIADYVDFVKLFEVNEDFKINGGLIVQPQDVDVETSALSMLYAGITHSEKVMQVAAGKHELMDALMDVTAALFGGKEAIKERPRLLTIIDVNSPLMFDTHMTDAMFSFCENGQPFTVANCSMAGATAPMSMAASMVAINAEVLPVIALAQMINPGNPVIYGSQATTADMATGQIACGAPEGALLHAYTTEMARFYGIPSRGGGALTDSKMADAQAGYESMATLLTCYNNRMNYIIHAAGILDGYSTVSFEKTIMDFEVVRYCERMKRGCEVTDELLAVDEFKECGHFGEHLTSDFTLEHCRDEAMVPMISSRGVVADPTTQMNNRIQAQKERMLAAYKQPALDDEARLAVRDILAGAGVPTETLDLIETL